MVRYVRSVGRAKIMERISAFKNNEHMPDDILSTILTSYGKEKFIMFELSNVEIGILQKSAAIVWISRK